jgi:outer membrane protein
MKNPAQLQSQRQLNVAHLQMQEIRAERYPGVFLVGGYFYNVNNSQAGFFAVNQQNGYNYGITASWSVFNGLNLNRRVQNAKILAESAELTNESLQLSLEADISKAYAGYQTNLNLIAIERLNLEVAKENEEIALERYQLGNSTPLELREAQINAVQAESRLINAAFSTKLAEIELLRLSGSLIQTYSE